MPQAQKDAFYFVIDCYNKSGLRKTSPNLRKLVSIYLLLPLLFILYSMIIINIRYKNANIFEIAEVFEAVSTFGQLVARKSLLLLHRSLFEEIIQDRSHFWSYDSFGGKIGDKYRQEMQFSVSLIKKMWYASVWSLVFHFCTPFFVTNAVLPDACWIPVDSKCLVIFLYALEMVFYIEVIFLLGSFDAFFLCMCTELKIQFNLLNRTLDKLQTNPETTDEMWLKTLKKCSRHHCFILKVHAKLNRFFSEYFVCQYLINVGGVCIQFFIISNESSNLTQILRSVVYILIASLLGALIFLPSSAIEEEAEKFENRIYDIEWQNTKDLNIRKFIIFWLMKAQKSIHMTGAGLFQVNRNVLIQIPRLAFSIATILSNVK
nr:PREDICTED: uncharacterized protein LOC103314856 isoform X2 [Tribolium castaneum]|eukprot:XP_015836874.1 PREDICTED: uncharacterized protein LOC103314856 isoform X2 [Tribolium castaneum]